MAVTPTRTTRPGPALRASSSSGRAGEPVPEAVREARPGSGGTMGPGDALEGVSGRPRVRGRRVVPGREVSLLPDPARRTARGRVRRVHDGPGRRPRPGPRGDR